MTKEKKQRISAHLLRRLKEIDASLAFRPWCPWLAEERRYVSRRLESLGVRR